MHSPPVGMSSLSNSSLDHPLPEKEIIPINEGFVSSFDSSKVSSPEPIFVVVLVILSSKLYVAISQKKKAKPKGKGEKSNIPIF